MTTLPPPVLPAPTTPAAEPSKALLIAKRTALALVVYPFIWFIQYGLVWPFILGLRICRTSGWALAIIFTCGFALIPWFFMRGGRIRKAQMAHIHGDTCRNLSNGRKPLAMRPWGLEWWAA